MGNTASDHAKIIGTNNGQTTNTYKGETIARGAEGRAIASGGHYNHHYDDTLGMLVGEGHGGGGEVRYARSTTTKIPMTKEELQSLQIEIHDDVRRLANTVEDVRLLFFIFLLALAVVAIAALVWYCGGLSRRCCEGWPWWKRERASRNMAALDRTRQQALGGNYTSSNENNVNSNGGGSGGNTNSALGVTPRRDNNAFTAMDLHETP